MLASPSKIQVSLPDTPGGTMILWVTISVSCTVPSTSPPVSSSPTLATGVKAHSFSWSRASTMTPRGMRSPACSRILVRGRWMPS